MSLWAGCVAACSCACLGLGGSSWDYVDVGMTAWPCHRCRRGAELALEPPSTCLPSNGGTAGQSHGTVVHAPPPPRQRVGEATDAGSERCLHPQPPHVATKPTPFMAWTETGDQRFGSPHPQVLIAAQGRKRGLVSHPLGAK